MKVCPRPSVVVVTVTTICGHLGTAPPHLTCRAKSWNLLPQAPRAKELCPPWHPPGNLYLRLSKPEVCHRPRGPPGTELIVQELPSPPGPSNHGKLMAKKIGCSDMSEV